MITKVNLEGEFMKRENLALQPPPPTEELSSAVDFQPLHEQVVIYRLKFEQVHAGSGLILSTDAMSDVKDNTGIVVAVGPDVQNVKPGDTIVFRPGYGNIIYTKTGYQFYAVAEEGVLAVYGAQSRKLVTKHQLQLELHKAIGSL